MARKPSAAAAHIGRRIQGIRGSRALTVDALAAWTGIDSANIRGYEAGRAMPSIETLVRIAEALEVAPGDLLVDLDLSMFGPRGTLSEG